VFAALGIDPTGWPLSPGRALLLTLYAEQQEFVLAPAIKAGAKMLFGPNEIGFIVGQRTLTQIP
jgi:hypothetical protein